MSRVVSKNLFPFNPKGQLDDDIIAMESEEQAAAEVGEVKQMMDRMVELQDLNDEESNMEFVSMMRAVCDPYDGALSGCVEYQESMALTDRDVITVPTSHDGEFEVSVEVYTPQEGKEEGSRAGYIYAHGGGCVAMSAAQVAPLLQHVAVQCNLVVFNVDYRISPEARCPTNIKDFYSAIKYITQNADSFDVDPAKICIAGDSGGGYVCLGAMVLLAQHNETHLVKLAIPGVPMVDDYCFSDPLAMTVEERKVCPTMRKIWRDIIAANYEEQKNNPHLFPGKASDELLALFPPTVVMECEFDIYITEASRLATRLRRVGRLLEFVVVPGASHASSFLPNLTSNQTYFDALKTILKEYLCN